MKTIGVFVNEDPGRIEKVVGFCGLDLVQLHGDESPEVCSRFMPHTIKALRVKDKSMLEGARSYLGKVKALLFDTYSEEKRGGTGRSFDWTLAVTARQLGIPIILSGGLNPGNIEDAISIVRPCAVDVNSGIEERPGRKSPVLVKELMNKIRGINSGGFFDD